MIVLRSEPRTSKARNQIKNTLRMGSKWGTGYYLTTTA